MEIGRIIVYVYLIPVAISLRSNFTQGKDGVGVESPGFRYRFCHGNFMNSLYFQGQVMWLIFTFCCYCSVTQSCVTLPPPGLQHTRLPCPSPSPGACSNSCPLSQWCHPTILFSVIPFSSCLQPFPASESFPTSRLFASGGQSIGASASASVLPMNIQGWFPLGLTSLICLQSERLSRVFLKHCSSKTSILQHSAFFMVQLSHPYMTTGKKP